MQDGTANETAGKVSGTLFSRFASRYVCALKAGVRPITVAFALVFGLVFAIASVFGGALAQTGFSELSHSALVVPFLLAFVIGSAFYLVVPAAFNVSKATASDVANVRGRHVRASKEGARGASADADAARPCDRGRGRTRNASGPAGLKGPAAADSPGSFIAPQWGVRSVALHTLVMFALWFVYLVALFPGAMNWDTFYQIDQCYPDGTVWAVPWAQTGSVVDAHFSDHHPIFDTLLYGFFARASDALFGTWNYGVFAFIVIQAALTALSFTVAMAYLKKNGTPSALVGVLYLFFCLAPFYPFYAATMLKDSTSAPLFVVYLLMLVECARTRGDFLAKNKAAIVWFVVVGLLLALTKKPGMYVVMASGVVLLFVYRRAWKAYLAQVGAIVVVMMVVMPLVVFPLLDVIPGGKQEARGMLFQQTARFALLYPDEVTDGERAVIDRVIGYDDLAERYDPFNSDPVKFWYRYETCTNEDLTNYYGVWLAQGLRHPSVYIDAALATAAPYIDFSGELGVHANTGDVEHAGSPLVWQPQVLGPLRDAVVAVYGWLSGAPVIGLLFRTGTYAYFVPTLAFMVLLMRRSRYLPVFVPIALSLAVCVVTPMFHARYALPLIYVAPLLIGLCFMRDGRAPIGVY